MSLVSFPSWGADFNKGLTAAQNGDFATAFKEWKPLAEQGYASAQYNLGAIYENGWGVLLCPHTATAAFVRGLFPDDEFIIVGTAHPSKFDDVLSPLLGGKSLPLPSGPKTLVMRTPKFKTLPSNFDQVKQALLQEL